jgi:hypothetical protein
MLEAIDLPKSYSGSVALDQLNLTAWFIPKVVKRAKLTALDIEFRKEPFPEVTDRVLPSLATLRRYSVAA